MRTFSNQKESDIKILFKKYKQNNSIETRNELIEYYLPFVQKVANIVNSMNLKRDNSLDYDDLVSEGVFGLIKAIDRYDLNRNIKFETYASKRIKGSMQDFIRKTDFVPRTIRKRNKHITEIKNSQEELIDTKKARQVLEEICIIEQIEKMKKILDNASKERTTRDKILNLKYAKEKTFLETSQILEIKRGTVSSHVNKFLKEIRHHIVNGEIILPKTYA